MSSLKVMLGLYVLTLLSAQNEEHKMDALTQLCLTHQNLMEPHNGVS